MGTAVLDPPVSQHLREFSQTAGQLAVDRAAGIVRGVKVLGQESTNGRTYSTKAMQEARALYEGVAVNIDHRAGEGTSRSYAERFGRLKQVVFDGSGLRADLHFNPKHALAEQFAWDAEHGTHGVGLSHDIVGQVTRRDGRAIVEAITKVHSVDLVADPATTRSLHESTDPPETETVNFQEITLASLTTNRPDLLEAHKATLAASAEQQAKDAELKTLREKLDRLEAEKAAALLESTIAAEIAAAKLPERLVTDTFRQTLREAKDAVARQALIEDRAAIGKAAAGGTTTPVSREQRTTEGHDGDQEPGRYDSGKAYRRSLQE